MCAAVKIGRLGKFDLNPRGDLWRKDENRFGHKLLSKLGWSQGKGLGKNEDGIAENLKVRLKVGSSGVGWQEKMPLALESQEYDSVLANLNEKYQTSEKVKSENKSSSLEQRSQQFKNRLHYQKFVRGKDVCRYSEKDMNSIFITRKSKAEPTEAISTKSSITNVDSRPTSQNEMHTFNSKMSVKDYFAMKLKKKLDELPKETTQSTKDAKQLPITEPQTPCRKRKQGSKVSENNKRLKLEETDATSNEPSCDAADITVESETQNSSKTGVLNGTTEKQSSKRSKKRKNGKLKQLKSCLRKTGKYSITQDIKEVSFNDVVFYKTIEDDCVEDVDLREEQEKDEENVLDSPEEGECTDQDEEEQNGGDPNPIHDELNQSHTLSLDELPAEASDQVEEDSSEIPSCLDLPKCDGSNFNGWLESQRIAAKMKLYKNLTKKIRRHRILAKTNLLDIKGYGNWGL